MVNTGSVLDETKNYERFEDFGLSEEILLAIQKKGYEKPTEIQKNCFTLRFIN